jgi:hypothetical protein
MSSQCLSSARARGVSTSPQAKLEWSPRPGQSGGACCAVWPNQSMHTTQNFVFFHQLLSAQYIEYFYRQLFYSSVQRVLLYTHHSCYESADCTMLWLWQSTEAVGGHRTFHHTAHLGNWSVFSQFVSQLLACVTFFHFVFFGHITATGYCLPITRVITQPLASTYPSLVL